jgi:glycosyltransferase involved in cell wall biosynthesis
MNDMSEPLITIIIPAYNSQETIGRTLEGIAGLKADFEFETLVVDSSPNEGTSEIIRRFPMVTLIRSPHKLTPAQARNRGASEARGRYLAFTDSDTEIPGNWLEAIKAALDSGHDYIAGAIGNSPLNDNFWSKGEYYFEFNEHSPYQPAREIWFAGSCNFICPREVYLRVGGFPDHRGAEDVILSKRLKGQGARFFFHPEVVVYHRNRRTAKKVRVSSIIIGKYNGLFRKMGLMPNFGIINRPYLCWLAVPFFVIYKSLRIMVRIFKTDDPRKWEFAWTFPVYIYIMIFWSIGFYIGAYGRNPDITR